MNNSNKYLLTSLVISIFSNFFLGAMEQQSDGIYNEIEMTDAHSPSTRSEASANLPSTVINLPGSLYTQTVNGEWIYNTGIHKGQRVCKASILCKLKKRQREQDDEQKTLGEKHRKTIDGSSNDNVNLDESQHSVSSSSTPTISNNPNTHSSQDDQSRLTNSSTSASTDASVQYNEQDYQRAKRGDKDLAGVNLQGADLHEGFDFSEADLSEANLSGANLTGVNLSGANLVKANLTGTNFTKATLCGAEFQGQELKRTNFTGANLSEAKFIDIKLLRVILINTCLNNAILQNVNIEGSTLKNTKLIETTLIKCNLSRNFWKSDNSSLEKNNSFEYSKMNHVKFFDFNLNCASFRGSTLENTSFFKCKLIGIDMQSAALINVFFKNNEIELINFSNSSLTNTIFTQNIKDNNVLGKSLIFENTDFDNVYFFGEGQKSTRKILEYSIFTNSKMLNIQFSNILFKFCEDITESIINQAIFTDVEFKDFTKSNEECCTALKECGAKVNGKSNEIYEFKWGSEPEGFWESYGKRTLEFATQQVIYHGCAVGSSWIKRPDAAASDLIKSSSTLIGTVNNLIEKK